MNNERLLSTVGQEGTCGSCSSGGGAVLCQSEGDKTLNPTLPLMHGLHVCDDTKISSKDC